MAVEEVIVKVIKYLGFCLKHKKTPRWEGAWCVGGVTGEASWAGEG